MDIQVSAFGSAASMRLIGRFVFDDHKRFKEAYLPLLQQNNVSHIEIDLERVVYLDSSALGMLLLLRDRALAVNRSIILTRPSTIARQVLDIANFAKLFTIR